MKRKMYTSIQCCKCFKVLGVIFEDEKQIEGINCMKCAFETKEIDRNKIRQVILNNKSKRELKETRERLELDKISDELSWSDKENKDDK